MMRIVRALHKWIGLIAGLQLLVWLLSGLVMSLLDHHVVSGDSITQSAAPAPGLAPGAKLIEPRELLARHSNESVRGIALARQLDRWIWRVDAGERIVVYDGPTGERLVIDEERARALAAADRIGDMAPRSATLLEAPTQELRDHEGPAWRVDFNDAQQTRYYLAADDGRILARRTGDWRVFDFFWMLHTMDYRTRDDFNNPLAVTFAFLTVWLSITGAVLLVRSFSRRA